MTNILIVGYEHMPTFDMTAIAFERYSKYIPISVQSKLSRDISGKDMEWCDIFMCVRGDDPLSAYLCKVAKKINKKVILTIDDDLLEYTLKNRPLYDRLRKHSLKRVISCSDIILTTSGHLGQKLSKGFDKPYVVTNTVVDDSDRINNHSESKVIRILYACSHNVNFIKFISPILPRLAEKYGNRIALTIVGAPIDTSKSALSVTHIKSMPLDEYRDYMNTHFFDIGLAPLEDTEMTRSKYFNKFLEYTNNQIVGIYSNNLPYTLVVSDGVNGLLADNNPDSWFERMCQAIEGSELRRRCLSNAQKYIEEHHSLERILTKLTADIPDLTTYKSSEKQSCHLTPIRLMYFIHEFLVQVECRIGLIFSKS